MEKTEFWTEIKKWVDLNSKEGKKKYSEKEAEDMKEGMRICVKAEMGRNCSGNKNNSQRKP